MKEETEWRYSYPGENEVIIRVGDEFKISRVGQSGRRFESLWVVSDLLKEFRIREAGFISGRVIVAKLNKGRYVDEWGKLTGIKRDKTLKFDDYTVAHRLKANRRQAA